MADIRYFIIALISTGLDHLHCFKYLNALISQADADNLIVITLLQINCDISITFMLTSKHLFLLILLYIYSGELLLRIY